MESMLRHGPVIVGIGSSNRPTGRENPLTASDRRILWQSVFQDRIAIVDIPDKGAKSPQEWTDWVRGIIAQHNLPQPTDYWGGEENTRWITDMTLHTLPRWEQGGIPVSGTFVRSLFPHGDWQSFTPVETHGLLPKMLGIP